jgi:hypothetical protein
MHYHLLVTIIAAFLILGVNASSPPSATVEAGIIIGTTTSIQQIPWNPLRRTTNPVLSSAEA